MKKRIVYGLIVLSLLACNTVTQVLNPPTALPPATETTDAPFAPTSSALAPAYVPPECVSVAPATVSPQQVLPTPTLEPTTEISQGTQLQIFDELIEIIDAVYVYPDFNGKDWKEIKARYRAKIEAGISTEQFYVEVNNMIVELGDEHSFYLSPIEAAASEAELRGENNYVGVGVYSIPDPERQTFTVISTFPDSPARHAGIQPHDRIIAVDGTPLIVDENTASRVRGPQCSAVTLTVQSPGEAPRDLLIYRAPIKGNLTIEQRLVPTSDGSKIGYIFIPSFFDETLPPQIEQALKDFGDLDGLILDLRLNGGGSSSVVDPILEWFTDGHLGKFVSRDSSRSLDVDGDGINNSQTVPLVIIVSKDTVSYGEIFTAILKDSGRAKVTGETSLGNVEVLNGYDFEDDSQLWIAAETFYSATSDTNFEETGIVPDLEAYAPWDTITFETDPSIKAALELLGHK
ncbi:MAG: PDZ domain-containing protein [Anaerolineales bacterium]|nr:PDZ domain-containing protein [Anaerolineales bacterium]